MESSTNCLACLDDLLNIENPNFEQTISRIYPTEFQLNSAFSQILKVRKMAKIRNQHNQAPNLTMDTNWKVTTSQLDITNESQ